jgi:hypothetical protein
MMTTVWPRDLPPDCADNLFAILATENGPLIGLATFDGVVSFSQVVVPDPKDLHLTALLQSDETTEVFTMIGTNRKFYGFECYFKPVSEIEIHISENPLLS